LVFLFCSILSTIFLAASRGRIMLVSRTFIFWDLRRWTSFKFVFGFGDLIR
jgi:hypothetical protein